MSFINNLRVSATPSIEIEKSIDDIVRTGNTVNGRPHYIRTAEEDKAYHDYWIQKRLDSLYGKPSQKRLSKSLR